MHGRSALRLVGLLAGAGIFVFAASADSAPVPVKASPRNEVTAAAGGEYFAWAKSRRRHPGLYDVWAQRGADTSFKVNAPGTYGWAGGIDGPRLVYQEVRNGLQSDIRFFDLATRRNSRPAGVNTKRWEWAPTSSGDWLLFGRGMNYSSSTQQIILRNLATGEQRVLDRLRNKRALLAPGQVNGNYAVWTKCTRPTTGPQCDVFRYDIAARTKTEMPRTGQFFYGPSITPTGTTYYGRSSFGCGAGAELVKTTLDGTTLVLYSFPGGQDVGSTYAVVTSRPPDLETTRIYFERVTCSGSHFDIYSIDDVVQAPPP
jgi:hypothetical protein